MEKIVLQVDKRTEVGKGPNRRLRSEGKVPAVLYGGANDPVKLSLSDHELEQMLKQKHAMMTISHEGAEHTVMLGEIQRDPLSRRLIHVDLVRVEAGHEVHARVEVAGIGNPIGVREGGLLERPVREIEIRCLPADLPEKIEVDISELKVNDSIKVKDLPMAEGVHLVSDPDTLLFHVVIPKAAVEPEAPAEGEEAAAPELVGKKKEEAEAEK